ncbi:kinase-like domain-containing protein [Hypomontagnella monticulosa]|nr:kinase-like domain-containing protein [Hypomontagnella monticulosa]
MDRNPRRGRDRGNEPDIPGLERLDARATDLARDLLKRFRRKGELKYEFEKIIGHGSWGFTMKMRVNDGDSGPSLLPKKVKRFVIKRALTEGAQANLRRELGFLQQLQGSMNIQQLYHVEGEPVAGTISWLKGPSLVSEWIENGLIQDLLGRIADWNQPLPNRMLWRIFLCFVRMLVAMAWPGVAIQRNEVLPRTGPSGNRPLKSRILHGDFNIQNVMVGDFDQLDHRLVPIIKLIDFGGASELPDTQSPESAAKANMYYVGEIMLSLIGGGSAKYGSANMLVSAKGKTTTIKSNARDLDGLNPVYKAPQATVKAHKAKMDNLDGDLRNLVIRCLAVKIEDRPALEELAEEVERHVKEKRQEHYAGKQYYNNESDMAIRRIAGELMCNAAN